MALAHLVQRVLVGRGGASLCVPMRLFSSRADAVKFEHEQGELLEALGRARVQLGAQSITFPEAVRELGVENMGHLITDMELVGSVIVPNQKIVLPGGR